MPAGFRWLHFCPRRPSCEDLLRPREATALMQGMARASPSPIWALGRAAGQASVFQLYGDREGRGLGGREDPGGASRRRSGTVLGFGTSPQGQVWIEIYVVYFPSGQRQAPE